MIAAFILALAARRTIPQSSSASPPGSVAVWRDARLDPSAPGEAPSGTAPDRGWGGAGGRRPGLGPSPPGERRSGTAPDRGCGWTVVARASSGADGPRRNAGASRATGARARAVVERSLLACLLSFSLRLLFFFVRRTSSIVVSGTNMQETRSEEQTSELQSLTNL